MELDDAGRRRAPRSVGSQTTSSNWANGRLQCGGALQESDPTEISLLLRTPNLSSAGLSADAQPVRGTDALVDACDAGKRGVRSPNSTVRPSGGTIAYVLEPRPVARVLWRRLTPRGTDT